MQQSNGNNKPQYKTANGGERAEIQRVRDFRLPKGHTHTIFLNKLKQWTFFYLIITFKLIAYVLSLLENFWTKGF